MNMSGWVSLGVILTAALMLAARAIWVRTHPPLQPMTAPSTEPFLLRYARQAAQEQRLVWFRYRQPDGQVTEGPVEIYHTTGNGHVMGWCRTRRCRCTFRRDRVLAWQLLDKRFERVHNMEDWAKREGWSARMRELKGATRKH